MTKIILHAIVILVIAFAGIAKKVLVKRDGKFADTCSSNNPLIHNCRGLPVVFAMPGTGRNANPGIIL